MITILPSGFDELLWGRQSVKGGSPWRGLVEFYHQSNGQMNLSKITEIYVLPLFWHKAR